MLLFIFGIFPQFHIDNLKGSDQQVVASYSSPVQIHIPNYSSIFEGSIINCTIKGTPERLYWSIDNTIYGNIDNDITGFCELKTGRIYGFSISDVSSYIARSVFNDKLPQVTDYMFIGQGGASSSDRDAEAYANLFN